MSYKTKWFNGTELRRIAKMLEHEQIYLSASDLADRLSAVPGDKDHGGFGSNIDGKLRARGVSPTQILRLLT